LIAIPVVLPVFPPSVPDHGLLAAYGPNRSFWYFASAGTGGGSRGVYPGMKAIS
jgi:hypothetical protein